MLLAGVNDSPDDARQLAKLLSGVKSKVNLIPLNAAPGIPFERPSDEAIDRFARILADRGLLVSVRKSRGRDIRAACGQLIVDGQQRSPGQRLAPRSSLNLRPLHFRKRRGMKRRSSLSPSSSLLAHRALVRRRRSRRLEFEVASVKPFSIAYDGRRRSRSARRSTGAQVRIVGADDARLHCDGLSRQAVPGDGADWMATERYDINAKLPDGSAVDKIPEMMQSLLTERFGLEVHRDKKEMPVYVLLVGKPPLKLTDSAVDPNAPAPTAVQVISATGSAAGVGGQHGQRIVVHVRAAASSRRRKFNGRVLAAVLERYADRPVMDATA